MLMKVRFHWLRDVPNLISSHVARVGDLTVAKVHHILSSFYDTADVFDF